MKEESKKILTETELINEAKRLALACLIKKLELVLTDRSKYPEKDNDIIRTGLATHSLLPDLEPGYEIDDPPGEQLQKIQNL